MFKPCYYKCKKCSSLGDDENNNCIEYKDDYYNGNYFSYIASNKITETTFLNMTIYNILELDFSSLPNEIISESVNDKNETVQNRTELIQKIIDNLFNELNMTEIDNGIDKKIVEKNIVFLFTSTLNQKNNEDKNNITMNLGQCENLLKNDYNISDNDSLYILQIISEENGMKIPKIEYEVYYPLYNSNNLTKLNLTSCQDTKIEISIAVSINEDLDKYNSSSDYYNDICSKTTSESGTDISLKDRKNEFVDNNMSLCEENCELIDYDYSKEKAKCSCDVKLSIPSNYDIKFNKKDFLKSFIDIKNIANLNIMKCYKIVFKIKDLIKNYGFFIISIIIVLYFITLIIFWAYSYNKLKNDINIMISLLKINETTITKNDTKKIIKKNNKKKVKRKKKIKNNNMNSEFNNLNNKIELKNNYDENIEKRNYSGLITQNLEDKSINIMKNDILLNINKNDIYAKSLLEEKRFRN